MRFCSDWDAKSTVCNEWYEKHGQERSIDSWIKKELELPHKVINHPEDCLNRTKVVSIKWTDQELRGSERKNLVKLCEDYTKERFLIVDDEQKDEHGGEEEDEDEGASLKWSLLFVGGGKIT